MTVDLPLSDTYFVVGALPHGDGRVADPGGVRRDLSLVPEDHGPDARTSTLGKIHFWMTFLGTYAIYLPMHYLGILGVPRRYYALGDTEFIPDSVHTMNEAITHRRARRRGGAADLPVST